MRVAIMMRVALVVGFFLAVFAVAQLGGLPIARITVRVRDQDGNAVPAASLRITGDSAGREKSPKTYKVDVTDNNGIWEGELESKGEVLVSAGKEGYYKSNGVGYDYRSIPDEWERAVSRKRWEPWNLTIDVTLRKIIKPVPMYARAFRGGLPSTVGRMGFDLVIGDYIQPYGRGEVSDLIFIPVVEVRADNDYDLKLSVKFSNEKDGIMPFAVLPPLTGSELRSPHQAPETGYLAEWMVWRSRRPNEPEWSNYDPENHAYFIRVRTRLDKAGNIVSAHYGKIYGDFMKMTYYLNPTPGDRNLEFDTNRNLFHLEESEEVVNP